MCCILCRAREALRQCLPDQLKDNTFAACLKDDNSTKRWLSQLQVNLEAPSVPDPRGIPPLHPGPQWLEANPGIPFRWPGMATEIVLN